MIQHRLFASLVICALILCAWPTQVEARSVYRRGEILRFDGIVTGAEGHPLSGLTVALKLSHRGFSLRDLSPRGLKDDQEDTLQILATTDTDGRYMIEWSWDSYYNVFELLVALPIEHSASPKLEVLERVDITSKIEQTNPIITSLSVQSSAFVNWLQGYRAGGASSDASRIFREMGRPERFDVVPEDDEMSWWYFEAGKVYRFKAGALEQVTHFEPVKSEL